MDELFVKVGKRYIKYGYQVNKTDVHDGIWLVSSNLCRKQNLSFIIQDLPQPIDINMIANLELIKDDVCNEVFKQSFDKSLSLNDIYDMMIKELYKKING